MATISMSLDAARAPEQRPRGRSGCPPPTTTRRVIGQPARSRGLAGASRTRSVPCPGVERHEQRSPDRGHAVAHADESEPGGDWRCVSKPRPVSATSNDTPCRRTRRTDADVPRSPACLIAFCIASSSGEVHGRLDRGRVARRSATVHDHATRRARGHRAAGRRPARALATAVGRSRGRGCAIRRPPRPRPLDLVEDRVAFDADPRASRTSESLTWIPMSRCCAPSWRSRSRRSSLLLGGSRDPRPRSAKLLHQPRVLEQHQRGERDAHRHAGP